MRCFVTSFFFIYWTWAQKVKAYSVSVDQNEDEWHFLNIQNLCYEPFEKWSTQIM
jgi:hypothetical protein